jgi:hypothetical protein
MHADQPRSTNVIARRLLRLVPAVTLLMGAAIAVAPPPAMAGSQITVNVEMGGCFGGSRPEYATLDVVWTDSRGHTKASFTANAGEYGWDAKPSACVHHVVAPGDTIQVHETAPQDLPLHTFHVPTVRATFDRTTGVVSGHVPAGGTIGLTIGRPDLGSLGIPKTCILTPVRDARGNFRKNTTNCVSGYHARGGDAALVGWANAAGDSVRNFVYAPYLEIELHTFRAEGQLFADTTVPLTVVSQGTTRATATAAGDSLTGAFHAAFHFHGHTVTPRVGDVVRGRWAGSSMTSYAIPRLTLNLSTPTAIVGTCTPHTAYAISIARDGNGAAYTDGTTDGSGHTLPFDPSSFTLQTGDLVTFTCARGNGDRTSLGQTYD